MMRRLVKVGRGGGSAADVGSSHLPGPGTGTNPHNP
jgi:hypothetical protein